MRQFFALTVSIATVAIVVPGCGYISPHSTQLARFHVIPLAPRLDGEQSRWVRLDSETGNQQFCTSYRGKMEADGEASKIMCSPVIANTNDPLGILGGDNSRKR